MKCNECLKELNEMTLYCDRCGAQLSKEKINLNFEVIEKQVLPLGLETYFTKNQTEEIKTAFFLSNIKNDFKGFKRRYIDQYIDYVLLRTYYEKNKFILTSKEYDLEKALGLLTTFEKHKPTQIAKEILEEEYGDDYENKVIPKTITDQVERIYCVNYNLRLLSPVRFLSRIIFTTLIGSIRMAIPVGAIFAGAYILLPDLVEPNMSNPILFATLGGILLVLGYLSSRKNRKYYPFEDIIKRNSEFNKHVKTEMKKRIKTIKYRIKKEGRR